MKAPDSDYRNLPYYVIHFLILSFSCHFIYPKANIELSFFPYAGPNDLESYSYLIQFNFISRMVWYLLFNVTTLTNEVENTLNLIRG
jgi:hypothetical protein